MKTIFCLPLACLLLCAACSHGKANDTSRSEAPVDTITSIKMPAIPPMLDNPELRADFLVRNYWQHVNFADTNYIHHPEITEQAWVDYIDLLKLVPPATADAAINTVFKKAEIEKKSYLYLVGMADKYLYDPNSPMRHEELYISVLDVLLASPVLDDTEKIRPKARRELAERNRLGSKAIDFTYTLPSGKSATLYAIQAPYTLLFINNPGCHACGETIDALKNAPTLNNAIRGKQLKVLALYPDEEVDEWKRHLADFPAEWINGYDRNTVLKEKNLYDLKAIPTLYLLDRDKKVLLKDATAIEIEQYLATK